jgi:RNA polymerase sigma factor (TIGR02999 family)
LDTTAKKWETLTTLFERIAAGDCAAQDLAFDQVYGELHAIAARIFSNERPGHTLQPTALLNEAFLRLSAGATVRFQDRAHFFAVAARQMRRILVDHARRKNAEKRGGDGAVTVTIVSDVAGNGPGVDILDLNAALSELADLDDRTARVVELRFFAGFTEEETALALDVSPATVRSDWRFAKGWLLSRLGGQAEDSSKSD